MKLSELLLADSAWADLQQNRRIEALESSAFSRTSSNQQNIDELRYAVKTQAAQIRSLAGALTVLSATVDLLGDLVIEKGVVDEADFYDRLIDVVTAAQSHQEKLETDAASKQKLVVCVSCGKKVPEGDTTRVATGPACARCTAEGV